MTMNFAYYIGCAAQQTQKEADWAAEAVCEELGIKLHRMKKATCCGAVSLRETKPAFALAVAARIFVEAEEMGMDIATICNTCLQTLSQANHRLKNDDELLDSINEVLKKSGVAPYKGTVKIKHLAWVMVDDVEADVLKSKIKKPLNGLRVAPFYGCHSLRPAEIFEAEAGEKAKHLETLIELMGGNPVRFDGRDKCCGFHVMLSDAKEMRQMVFNNTTSAKEAGADVMITPCTLCDMAMGSYQGIAEKSVGKKVGLPEMNFAQLLGCAMGLDEKRLGLNRLHVSPRPQLVARGVL
ncbi:succinate dehydrogenase subunit C [Magnetococcus marinus MC-1]|uniref:Succinate dehydrogenase subunit C n=1 Tax=Magnetococcus marinus (strain ATCC BAA-1437 / JCM 17883 / MC-1) TaxID=156889 RepID=A0L4R1_MAGMM|nr:CoB--CoM heterodisulfide reductase iron-sulfur subunit B family protein [Magnetococcus marinus]ABK42954.1 succinate dehydrogenase subunit C [Magnetococcus marinus MC-1]